MKREVRLGVLASGHGSNLEALQQATASGPPDVRVVCLVSDNPEARAVRRARELGLAVFCVDAGPRRGRLTAAAEAEIVRFLRAERVDLVCLAGFMRIVGAELLGAFPGAVLNIHPSLLPSFPGLEAQKQALAYGTKVTGCTVHLVDAGVDTGPIVLQAAVPVHEEDTPVTLAARILEQEHELYTRAVRLWAEGRLRVEGRRVHILPPHRSVQTAKP